MEKKRNIDTRPVAYRLTVPVVFPTPIRNIHAMKVLDSGNGYFHRWFEEQMGDIDGVETNLWAVVEREDGSVIKVASNEIQFLGYKGKQ